MSEQAVIETPDEEPKVSSDEDNAQEPDLDSLLKEFDSTEETPQKEAQPAEDDVAWLRQQRMEYAQEQQDRAVNEAAGIIKETVGELPINLPDYVLEGILHRNAAKDKRIVEAFNNRFNQPEKWKGVVKAMGKQLAKDIKPTDKKATESWNAVESAVHSSSTHKEAPAKEIDWSALSNTQFEYEKARLERANRKRR